MDKSWISKDRDSLEFEIGIEEFFIFAEENCKDPKRIPCPCGRCVNFKKFSTKIIRGHIYDHGFSLGYVDWIWHEEKSTRSTRSSIGSTRPASDQSTEHFAASETVEVCEAAFNLGNYDKDSYDFQRFVVDAEQPLFKGSECTKLESMLKLHNWKARFGISDTAFTELLSSVGSILPKDNVLPPNAYEAKKTLSDLGLEYIKIHLCPNDCILYRGIHSDTSQCPHCKLSRWKVRKNGQLRVNVPAKRINDDKIRHPADSPSWRNIDYQWPTFGSESRNIRLALSADAYGNLSGCVNKGYKSCPISGDDIVAKYLSHSRKMCFQGHRRYLPRQHPYRRQKAAFNGQQELGNPCQPLSGEEVLARQERIDFCFGKEVKKSNKVVDVSKLDKLQSDIIITLCDLEKIFPSSFFDVMLHLIVHLVLEVRLCGPVFYRWMYAFKRFNKVLKSYVRNRYYPEGCMAESYLKEESVEFCTEFMSQTCTTAGIPVEQGKQSSPLFSAIIKVVEEKERDEAHLHVLQNNDEVYPYIVMHKEYLDEIYRGKKKSVHWLMGEHNRLFADWFEKKVSSEMKGNPDAVSETIRWLAGKPSFSVLTYQGFSVNGVRYFTKDRDDAWVVQNSGVSVVAKAVQVSSAKDLNPIESDITFNGIILEVWELDYHEFKAPLFLCKWAENDKGIKIDDLGFTLVDFNRQGHKKDKYVSVDQVNQVFYIKDPVDPTWSIVLTSTTRDYQELYNDDDLGDTIMEHPPFCSNIPASDVTNEDVAHSIRPNVEGIWVKK
ncbi:uncharacterized protein LOC141659093 [Apium graveolens]|uniref:uncharacterized protein LOC141659093 n=1 Tax=Apium graveolens TaxID=4045 RepID=UPI003D7BC9EB